MNDPNIFYGGYPDRLDRSELPPINTSKPPPQGHEMSDRIDTEALRRQIDKYGSQGVPMIIGNGILLDLFDAYDERERLRLDLTASQAVSRSGFSALRTAHKERDAEKVRANGAEIELTKIRQELRQAWSDYDTASKDASKAWGMYHAETQRSAAALAEVERLRGLLQYFVGSRRTVHCGSAVIKYEVGWNAESPIHEELMRAAYPPAVIPAVSKAGDA